MTWGFPCTDISIAGKQKCLIDECGNKTRSGLYYDGLRILKYKKPKYSIIENVKGLTQKKFKREFEQILNDLNESGYDNYWEVLNAKDFGIPQNRERVFIISIRKDIDDGIFMFPEKINKNVRVKDILENNVDKKYYINKTINLIFKDKYIQYDNNLKNHNSAAQRLYYNDSVMGSLVSNNNGDKTQIIDASKNEIKEIGELDIKGQDKVKRVYSEYGISPTIDTMQGGNRQPKILIENIKNNKELKLKDVLENEVDDIYYLSQNKTNELLKELNVSSVGINLCLTPDRLNKRQNGRRFKEDGEPAFTINTQDRHGVLIVSNQEFNNTYKTGKTGILEIDSLKNYIIRKLTPLECWRLMGYYDIDFYKVRKELNNKFYKCKDRSNSQLYKMAGNSIVVNVLEEIFKKLFKISV